MDFQDESLIRLWQALAVCKTQYVMIGGFAVNMNGFSRFTQDADILIHDTPENRKSFRKALTLAEIGDFELLETMEFIPGFTTILLDGGMDLDIFTQLPGFENATFRTIMEEALTTEIDGVSVRFLHLNQLIITKKFTNRPKDKIDVEELEKIKNISE